MEPERLMDIIERNAGKDVEELRDAVVNETLEWCKNKQKDDIALIGIPSIN